MTLPDKGKGPGERSCADSCFVRVCAVGSVEDTRASRSPLI